MTVINIHEAKKQLSRHIAMAAAGNDVIIARSGKPVARLTRLEAPKRKLKFGILKGKVTIPAEFYERLSGDTLKQFEAP